MSTFGGKIEEIVGICIDQFEEHKNNWEASVFFLSHCHYDHMRGLNKGFIDHLKQNDKFLYLSHLSAEILRRKFSDTDISNNLQELEVCRLKLIEVNDTVISVTAIPAGHCPGSVMFLLESTDKTVLYTGDFRLNSEDIRKFPIFYDSLKNKKLIHKIYLDTTFFVKSYMNFPSREDSLNEICSIISSWISKDPENIVQIIPSASYGYESLFMGIYSKLKKPIHISEEKYEFYSMIPEMDKALTVSEKNAQIHCSCGLTGNFYSLCDKGASSKVRKIKVSAWSWKNDDLRDSKLSRFERNCYMVCFATHASYEECLGLLNFLKPQGIEVNVWHDDEAKNIEIRRNIKEILASH